MFKLWIDNETVQNLISSGHTEVKNYGRNGDGKEYVEIFGIHFSRSERYDDVFAWSRDVNDSPLEATAPDNRLPLSRISLHDSFPGQPSRNRGIYQLGTATAELERREYFNDLDAPTITHDLKIWAEGGEAKQMFTDMVELWLAIKTGQLSEVTMTHSYEGEATAPKASEEAES